jgi:hypothetical protein
VTALPGTLETFPDLEQRTDKWYQQRCGLITASAVGKLLTPRLAVADNATSRGIVTVAAAERITGTVDPTFISVDMDRGIQDEPYAVDAYSEHHAPVTECGFMVRRWPGAFTLGYSPDGLVGDDGLIEVKSRRGKTQIETVIGGQVPAENMAQLQAGLFVSGRAWIDYVSYAGGMHLWTTRVTPDPAWFDAIRSAVEAFEVAVTATVDAYLTAVEGLPLTERPLLDMVI